MSKVGDKYIKIISKAITGMV